MEARLVRHHMIVVWSLHSMSSPLTGLEPSLVWEYFDQIRMIPRPSKHEEKILAWLMEWATEKGFETRQDAVGNLVMQVPATGGHDSAETVVLQGHVDMVPEKNRDVEHDFMTDPIQLEKDGDWIIAQDTTLGSDNGVGVAMAMAAATDPECVHPPLELLFTVDEETWLTGASGLEGDLLESRRLINLDTEEDGALYIGCAGGQDLHILFPIERVTCERPETVQVAVRGLRGGHSGVDIHENRANAVKVLARIVSEAVNGGVALDLVSIDGGSKQNAIPREAFAELCLEEGGREKLQSIADDLKPEFEGEFGRIDPDLAIEISDAEVSDQAFSAGLTARLLGALMAVPHGVMAMSRDVPGLVESSNNLAVVKVADQNIEIITSTRSSVMPALRSGTAQIRSVFELAGAKVEEHGGYPGWPPDPESHLLKVAKEVFNELFGREPKITAIHAGLECGIIGEKIPGIDMISLGPEIRSPHAPGEKVQISSVQSTWDLLKAYLKALAG
jgi:dipeptidase D